MLLFLLSSRVRSCGFGFFLLPFDKSGGPSTAFLYGCHVFYPVANRVQGGFEKGSGLEASFFKTFQILSNSRPFPSYH